MMWRETTTNGAVAGGFARAGQRRGSWWFLSKAVWSRLRPQGGDFPYDNPAFVLDVAGLRRDLRFSVLDKSKRADLERAAFDAQFVRSETGIGASGAQAHKTLPTWVRSQVGKFSAAMRRPCAFEQREPCTAMASFS